MQLSNFRSIFTHKITQILLIVIVIFFATALANILFFKSKPKLPEHIPPPVNQQPIKGESFDESAEISQSSKATIAGISSLLPHKDTINTTSGNKTTFVLISKPKDPYTLYVETININFQSDYTDPDLAKNVQDFRDTAAEILDWLVRQNVDTNQLFISWGGPSYVQKNAEAWLEESAAYPKVIKQNNKLVFEAEPQK